MNHLSIKDLVELLIKERDRHFSHIHEINRKVIFSMSGSISTIVIFLFVKSSQDDFNLRIFFNKDNLTGTIITATIFLIGYFFILWGLGEHSSIHGNQRKRIERAIASLLSSNEKEFNFNNFWKEHSEVHLNVFSKTLKKETPLISAEPDIRGIWGFHDRKIELGIFFILVGFLYLLIILFSN